MAFPLHQVKSL